VTAVAPEIDALLAAKGPARRRAARAALAIDGFWDAWRPMLAAALAADPGRARFALTALSTEARNATGPAAREVLGRLLTFEAHAAHRAGRMDDAVSLYRRASAALSRSGKPDDALHADIASIDALAAAGHVERALAVAARIAPRTRGRARRRAAAGLAVNRANALRLRGDVDEAAAAYAAAVRTFDALGDARRAAVTCLNAGVAAVEAGDAQRGRETIARAEKELAAGGYADLAVEARANLAWADVHAGRLGDGIRALDVLAQEHRAAGLHRREGVCRTDLADALRRAGDAATARREALRAAACFAAAHAPAERAEALLVAAASSALDDATRRADVTAARSAARVSGREALLLRAELVAAGEPATSRAGSRRSIDARRIARRARTLGHRALEADAQLVVGAQALEDGRPAAAERAFHLAGRLATGRPWTRLAAEAGRARVGATNPRGVAGSLARLRRLAATYDAIRADLPGGWLRSRFAADRLDPFLVRVDLLLERGTPRDLAEARAVLDALAARRVLRPETGPRDARTARIRARLEAIYDRIARSEGPVRGGDASMTVALERRARAWERAFTSRLRLAERRAPAASPLRPVRRTADRGDVTTLHLWRRGDVVMALVRDARGGHHVVRAGRAADWSTWAAGLRLARRAHLHRAGETDGAAARALLAAIAARLTSALDLARDSTALRIVADPALPDLPWELLPWRGDALATSLAVLRTPLGLVSPVARPSGEGATVVGIGDPDLCGVDAEVRAVASSLPGARAFVGAGATRAALHHALGTGSVVHVAGHGWDASDAPPLAGVRLSDGWFCADDVPPVVRADLVVLAACRTGRAAGPAALAWGGLVVRLLSRGARRVVWTDDDVDDLAAARLMAAYHATRRGWDDDRALGRALVRTAAESGHAGAVLPFRLSGVES